MMLLPWRLDVIGPANILSVLPSNVCREWAG